jgi:hypothetical protein
MGKKLKKGAAPQMIRALDGKNYKGRAYQNE